MYRADESRADWLEAHAQLLSVPAVFDESTATAVGSELAERMVPGSGARSEHAFRTLRLAGLVVRESLGWRVVDPLRGELRRRLQEENADLFQLAAARVLDSAENGLDALLRKVLGTHGAEVNLAALQIAAAPEDERGFERLVDVVEEGAYLGRQSDTVSATHLLRELPWTPVRGRQVEFLTGLSAWRRRKRAVAVEHFHRVLQMERIDRAAAISSHLVGVEWAALGNFEAAIAQLQRSVEINRQLGLSRGATVALTSLGRAQRDFASQLATVSAEYWTDPDVGSGGAQERLEDAIDTLQQAIDLGEKSEDDVLLGAAQLELSVAYQRQGNMDLAIDLAEEALDRIPRSDPRAIHARIVLGSLYKEIGDQAGAGDILEEGVRLARQLRTGELDLAMLLNVLASSERRAGRLQQALDHARLSVELGRYLRDARHLSQALHTLATVLIDIGNSDDLEQAARLLDESDDMLKRLNDRRGQKMVSQTRSRLMAKQEHG